MVPSKQKNLSFIFISVIILLFNIIGEIFMKQRDAYFDNIKGILISLVIIGHLIERFYFKSNLIKFLYTIIYSFHMPAFIFLSGLFFKPDLKKAFYFFKLFFIFQLFRLVFNYFAYEQNITVSSFLYPTWTLWYLLSMSFWYIISYFNQRIKISVLGMFSVSLLSGFIPYINSLISFQRTLAYLGFFTLGIYIGYKNFKKILKKFYIHLGQYIYITFTFCIFLIFVNINKIPIWLFYNNLSYLNINFFGNQYLNIFIRIFNFILAFVTSIILFNFIPNNYSLLTKLGKNSLWLYLTHTYLIDIGIFLIKYFR